MEMTSNTRSKTQYISWPGAQIGFIFPKERLNLGSLCCAQNDMTAIISAYTAEGFVVGADGRTLGHDKTIAFEYSQKIFNFKYRHIDAIYAWCGTTHVTDTSDKTIFNLNAIADKALNAAARSSGHNFSQFIQQCCAGIYDGIIQSPIVKQITSPDVPGNDSKARMLLNGYFDLLPFTANFYVRETDRIRISAEEIHYPVVSPTRNFFSGCGEQNKKFFNESPTTMISALKLVSNYIQGCIDSSEPDCFGMGGHKHIACLSVDGFYWVDGPKLTGITTK